MSYVDGSDSDYYGGDYPSKDDAVYSYKDSANSLEYSLVSSAAVSTTRAAQEPALAQESNDQAAAAKALDEFSKAQGARWALDYEIQKFQNELKADPHKFDDTKCFGPPSTQPQDFWDKAPEFPFREHEPEEAPEIPEKLYSDPFAKTPERMDWRTRIILDIFEKAEEE